MRHTDRTAEWRLQVGDEWSLIYQIHFQELTALVHHFSFTG